MNLKQLLTRGFLKKHRVTEELPPWQRRLFASVPQERLSHLMVAKTARGREVFIEVPCDCDPPVKHGPHYIPQRRA